MFSRLPGDRFNRGRVAALASGYPWDGIATVDVAFIADDAFITLNGSDVSNWASVKGSFNLVQGTAADQPAWNATGCNGKGSVDGDGVSEHMTCDAMGSAASGNDIPTEVILLYKHNTGTITANRVHWSYGNSADVDSRHYVEYAAGTGTVAATRRGDADASSVSATTTQTYANTNWHVMVVSFAGTTVTIQVDGSATSVTDAALDRGTCTLNRFTLMALRLNGAALSWNNISVSALVRSTAVLSAADRASIVNYLKTRAGI